MPNEQRTRRGKAGGCLEMILAKLAKKWQNQQHSARTPAAAATVRMERRWEIAPMRWGSRVARRKGRESVALLFCHPACATKQAKTHDWGWDGGQWYVNTKDGWIFQLPLDNYVATGTLCSDQEVPLRMPKVPSPPATTREDRPFQQPQDTFLHPCSTTLSSWKGISTPMPWTAPLLPSPHTSNCSQSSRDRERSRTSIWETENR